MATIPVRGYAQTVFQTQIAELAADPEGHGLDEDETRAYRLAASLYNDGRLRIPAERNDAETLIRLFTDICNAEDEIAEGNAGPTNHTAEDRRMARHAAQGMAGLCFAIGRTFGGRR